MDEVSGRRRGRLNRWRDGRLIDERLVVFVPPGAQVV
jgi:hypothetical protein